MSNSPYNIDPSAYRFKPPHGVSKVEIEVRERFVIHVGSQELDLNEAQAVQLRDALKAVLALGN